MTEAQKETFRRRPARRALSAASAVCVALAVLFTSQKYPSFRFVLGLIGALVVIVDVARVVLPCVVVEPEKVSWYPFGLRPRTVRAGSVTRWGLGKNRLRLTTSDGAQWVSLDGVAPSEISRLAHWLTERFGAPEFDRRS